MGGHSDRPSNDRPSNNRPDRPSNNRPDKLESGQQFDDREVDREINETVNRDRERERQAERDRAARERREQQQREDQARRDREDRNRKESLNEADKDDRDQVKDVEQLDLGKPSVGNKINYSGSLKDAYDEMQENQSMLDKISKPAVTSKYTRDPIPERDRRERTPKTQTQAKKAAPFRGVKIIDESESATLPKRVVSTEKRMQTLNNFSQTKGKGVIY